MLRDIACPGAKVVFRWPIYLLVTPLVGAVEVRLVPAANSPLAIAANCVAIVNINSDRHQDIIVTAGMHLQIYFGDGSGRFRTAPNFDLDMKERASEMSIADVNGDGKL